MLLCIVVQCNIMLNAKNEMSKGSSVVASADIVLCVVSCVYSTTLDRGVILFFMPNHLGA